MQKKLPLKPSPKIIASEEISEIPAEIRAKFNLIPATPAGQDDEESRIPPEVLANIRALEGGNPLGELPHGFSWAALVYGPFYYAAMKDWLFAGLSTLFSLLIYTLPLLIPLAFFARKRAWSHKKWESEKEYWQTQRQWDRSALFGAIFSIMGLYFVSHYIYTTLTSTFGTTDPKAVLQQVQNQYQP